MRHLLFFLFLFPLTSLAQDWPLPAVPSTLRTPAARAAYITLHYFDAIDFAGPQMCDSAYVEQGFATFAAVLNLAADSAQTAAIHHLVSLPANEWIDFFAEKYWAEDTSPQRNDRAFLCFLKGRAETSPRAKFLYAEFSKGKVGTAAPAFTFLNREGKRQSMQAAKPEAILFYNPDCDHCQQAIAQLRDSTHVLAIYGGNDKALWLRTCHTLPAQWTVGYAPQVAEQYYIPKMPYLYHLRNGIITGRAGL